MDVNSILIRPVQSNTATSPEWGKKNMLNTTQINHIQIIPLVFVTVHSPPPQLNDPVSFRSNKTFKVHFQKWSSFRGFFSLLLFSFFLLPHSCHWSTRKVGGGDEEEALFKSCHVALIHLLSLEGARDSSDGQELHSTHDTRTVWGIENCFLRKPSQLRTWPYWMSSVNLGFSSFSQ